MVKKKEKYSHPVKAALIKGSWWLLSRLPLRAIQALAIPVGKLVWRFSERERRVSQVNVELCFPEKTPWERDQLARGALIENARTLLEMGYLWLKPTDKVLNKVVLVEGMGAIEALVAEKKPVILLGPHIGQWEMIGQWFPTQAALTGMFSPSRVREVDDFVKSGRERTGGRLVPADVKGVAALLKALKRGEVVGILPDQEPEKGQGGVFAPFYGVPALTATLLPKLVKKTGARVFTACAKRLPKGQGYDIIILPADERVYSEDEVTAAEGVNASVEQIIEYAPLQYQWSYKRFKKRPDGGPQPYR
ncbi:KDO2-lipid IV(A) lauroyltransferase [Marinospirillum celere]|uniref:KDO2-lipid IV(A) lauroyltransferase n=1 Tax=Marinospirillum celere TaxID=1122252 RepID=A0A1I1J242_9GAMM|nr:lysophospholipid acyltransferase family protein [Marinospirillum celere]SFC42072.1 KDO2-lipid IV(A) lauroyltransferase [Marinospirillum celere]